MNNSQIILLSRALQSGKKVTMPTMRVKQLGILIRILSKNKKR